jgi:3-isopropylmalate dehydrogenase
MRSRVPDVIACLPGDGIGPEVLKQAVRVLEHLPLEVEAVRLPFGGAAIDEFGDPLPAETLEVCRSARAVLLGAVGGPKWDGGAVRPEAGLLGLRKALDVYANLRPATLHSENQRQVDLVIVRELIGGLYFGARGVRDDGTVFDTLEYHPSQIERVVRRGFELAAARSGSLVSVDKANVLDTSRLWRRIVDELAPEYPSVLVRHALVDSFAMELVTSADRIDVAVTENMFGDILSDVAAAVTGGLGLAASASLGDSGPGIFEPVHGSAPDIAGTGHANPTAMLRSVALMLDHGFGRADLAGAVVAAVEEALVSHPTPDAGGRATTGEVGDAVLASLDKRLATLEVGAR